MKPSNTQGILEFGPCIYKITQLQFIVGGFQLKMSLKMTLGRKPSYTKGMLLHSPVEGYETGCAI